MGRRVEATTPGYRFFGSLPQVFFSGSTRIGANQDGYRCHSLMLNAKGVCHRSRAVSDKHVQDTIMVHIGDDCRQGTSAYGKELCVATNHWFVWRRPRWMAT